MKQIYLIHSLDARWVTQQREDLLNELIPPEMREESLLEILSTSNRSRSLADVVTDVISELATIPFFPDSRRVVVVHNLSDFYAGGARKKKAKKKKESGETKKRKSPLEILKIFVEKDLPATPNVLVFSTIIESDRGQYLDTKSPLYKFIAQPSVGTILKPARKEQDPLFLMSDALLQRDTIGCLRHFRAVFSDDTRGRVFGRLLQDVRMLIQANVLRRLETGEVSRDLLETKYLPDDRKLNLFKQPDFVERKIRASAEKFQLRELMHAMESLLEINREMYPSKNAVHVRDAKILFEKFLVEFCEGSGTRFGG